MSEKKDCRKCMYFIGKLSPEPRFVWSYCRAGISNLTADSAKKCKEYAESYEEALKYRIMKLKKEMAWMIPLRKCLYCGAEIKDNR